MADFDITVEKVDNIDEEGTKLDMDITEERLRETVEQYLGLNDAGADTIKEMDGDPNVKAARDYVDELSGKLKAAESELLSSELRYREKLVSIGKQQDDLLAIVLELAQNTGSSKTRTWPELGKLEIKTTTSLEPVDAQVIAEVLLKNNVVVEGINSFNKTFLRKLEVVLPAGAIEYNEKTTAYIRDKRPLPVSDEQDGAPEGLSGDDSGGA